MEISIRPLREGDIPEARRIISLAFGTFVGVPEPETFMADRDYPGALLPATNTAAFAAELDGQFVGSNFATRWGSVGFFGPLSVHVDLWDQGVGQRLMEPVMEAFENWGVTHAGLFTFPQSPKHINLYQKFGFWPRYLTAVMSKRVGTGNARTGAVLFSSLSEEEQDHTLQGLRSLCHDLYKGLDLTDEIRSTYHLGLGDTIICPGPDAPLAFAICQHGEKSFASDKCCYVKFAAVRADGNAPESFSELLKACCAYSEDHSLTFLVAGVNLAREEAYRAMRVGGFKTIIQGVTMHKPNESAYSRAGLYVLDDWR